MQEDPNSVTINTYENAVEQYNAAAIPEVTGSVKEWVDASLALIPDRGTVLELGSAHGRDAQYIEDRGFKVYRTDAVHSFVNYLNKNGKSARILNALTDEYGGPYDLIYANAVLLHFTKEQVQGVFAKAARALSPNGYFAFSVKIGEGDAWSQSKLNAPRYFTYWQEQPLKELIATAHFEIVFWEEGSTGHDNSDWFHVILKPVSSCT